MFLISRNDNSAKTALNLILNLETYKKITKFVSNEDGWVCNAGAIIDPENRPYFVEPEPKWDGEYMTTRNNKRYTILHQWDKVLQLKIAIDARYGEII